MIRLLRTLSFAIALVPLGATALNAQKERTSAENCTLCEGKQKAMDKAGIVSHGPFPFGNVDTAAAEKLVPAAEIYWIESEHFRIGLGIGGAKVPAKEAKKVRAELERLRKVLPKTNPKVRLMKPWLRAHLYAQRFEDAYAEFLSVMQVKQEDFPTGEEPWILGDPYWGEGPYLGEKDKFEVLVLPNADQQVDYLSDQFGLQIRHTQKWNIIKRGCLNVVTNIQEDNHKDDSKLHGHLIFNLVHNFVDGFKYYCYDTPHWVQEGLGHVFERNLSPRFNSFSRSEGGTPLENGSKKWISKVKLLINSKKAPRLAELMNLKAYADFDLNHHYTCWSMVKFMLQKHPKSFADFNKMIHGRKKEDGTPDANDLPDVVRAAFKESFGVSYATFDRQWAEWALELDSKLDF